MAGIKILAFFGLVSIGLGNQIDYQKEFDAFVKSHNRVYRDNAERDLRFKTFVQNFDDIIKFTQNSKTATFGINKFSDWTSEEKARLTPYNKQAYAARQGKSSLGSCLTSDESTRILPASFDWRQSNIVTPVKDQGQCGSCWAFATIATVEAQLAKKTGQFFNLSEQELVDCAFNLGCNGGAPTFALDYILANGIANETTYPYAQKDQKCSADVKAPGRQTIDTDVCVDLDEDNTAYWLTKIGPVAYDIWVPESLYSYTSGILAPTPLECLVGVTKLAAHVVPPVTIVGFGEENGTPYWLIKNSWGADFGENGYFKLHRGDNACAMGLPHAAAVIWPL